MYELKGQQLQEIKKDIGSRLLRSSEDFVAIGWQLRIIDKEELYKEEGYGSLIELAADTWKLDKTAVSRFMKISEQYGDPKNPMHLARNYKGKGVSVLSEMLSLEKEEIQALPEKVTRADVREYRKEKKKAEKELARKKAEETPAKRDEVPKAGQEQTTQPKEETEPIKETEGSWILEFFRGKKEEFEKVLLIEAGKLTDAVMSKEEYLQDIINPSGSATFQHGMYYTFFCEAAKGINWKRFDKPGFHKYTYQEFAFKLSVLAAGRSYGELFTQKEMPGQIVDNQEDCGQATEKQESYPQKTGENAPVAPAQLDISEPGLGAQFEISNYKGVSPEKSEQEQIIEEVEKLLKESLEAIHKKDIIAAMWLNEKIGKALSKYQ